MNDKKDWTIMVYMSGDNNLSIDMAYALQQIKEVIKGKNEKINLFVYYDGFSRDVPTLYCDFSGEQDCVYYRSHLIENKLFPRKNALDENSAAAYSVINFVDWCVNKVEYERDGKKYKGRKADRYALIFSGHTAGFHSIGFLRDETSDRYMTMPKVLWLLKRITKSKADLKNDLKRIQKSRKKKDRKKLSKEETERKTTEILGQKLSFLGFDSCVMGMLEVGYQFKSVADIIVASEGSIPNAGWTYAQILGILADSHNETNVADIARDFVISFIRRQDSYAIGGVTVDLAAWDLRLLDDLEKSLSKLFESLLKCFKDKKSVIYRQMKRVLLQAHWNCQSYMFEQNIDLADFCLLLRQEVESLREELSEKADKKLKIISKQCDEVIKRVNECVILSGFSGGAYQYSNGISLFFPWSLSGYAVSRENYQQLRFIRNTEAGKSWNKFLEKYLGEVSFRKGKQPIEGGGFKIDEFTDVKDNAKDSSKGSDHTSYYSYVYKNEKVPVNADNRVPVNADNRVPVNADNRLFGNLSLFFDQLLRFKNIEAQWNVSGFSKKVEGSQQMIMESLEKTGEIIQIKSPPENDG